MSRIGKEPVKVPAGATVAVQGGVHVAGLQGRAGFAEGRLHLLGEVGLGDAGVGRDAVLFIVQADELVLDGVEVCRRDGRLPAHIGALFKAHGL
jgi:hypothetical protein